MYILLKGFLQYNMPHLCVCSQPVKSRIGLFVANHKDTPWKIFCSKELRMALTSPMGEGVAAKMC